MTPLEKLTRRINRNGDINDPESPRPLLTLEEFFDANDDYSSIGYNLSPDQPAPAEFYALFRSIRERTNVADVLVEVSQHEDPAQWPSTDTVWIVTTASVEDVRGWLGERFRPDEVWEGWTDRPREEYAMPAHVRPVGLWWD
jgi:hypothetical protein